MRVAVDVLGSAREPYLQVVDEHVLAMMLRHGSIEVGARRSAMRHTTFRAGEMGFFPRHTERWVGAGDQERLLLRISDTTLIAACDGIRGAAVSGHRCKMVDARLSALMAAVNAERIARFPCGRLFLDSVEQALAVALVDAYTGRSLSLRSFRGGLGPARLRTIKELVHAKMEDELSLVEMAESVELSPAYFARMFRKSTGETPHRFVLRNRIERAKEMLRAPKVRVLDVAVACGFKTQQHFARVFRYVCGSSPREYRLEWWPRDPTEERRNRNPRVEVIRPDWQAGKIVSPVQVSGDIGFQPRSRAQDRDFDSGKESTGRIADRAESRAKLRLRPGTY